MARVAMRSRGLSIKEKRVRYQDKIFTFKYMDGQYEVWFESEKVDTIATDNVHQAIAEYKDKNNKTRR